MLCTVVRQGQRNALHVRLIKSCHTTTVHTECFRGHVITCINVVIVGKCGCGWFRITVIYKEWAIILLEEWPDSGVGCHFASSSMHPFVYQMSRHRCRSVRTLKETKLVSLS